MLGLVVLAAAPPANAFTFAHPESVAGNLTAAGPSHLVGAVDVAAPNADLALVPTANVPVQLTLANFSARSLAVDQDSAKIVSVASPVGGSYDYSETQPHTTTVVDAATVRIERVGPNAEIFLAPATAGSAPITLSSPATDATLASGERDVVGYAPTANDGKSTWYNLTRVESGSHFRVAAGSFARVSATGAFSVFLYDVDFVVHAADGSDQSFTTGRSVESTPGGMVERDANAVLRVTDGTIAMTDVTARTSLFVRGAFAFDLLGELTVAATRGSLIATTGEHFAGRGAPLALDGTLHVTPALTSDAGVYDLGLAGPVSTVSAEPQQLSSQSAHLAAPSSSLLFGGLGLVALGAFATVIAVRIRRPDELDEPGAGVFAMERGDYRTALRAFEGAEPRDAPGWIDRGFCLERLGEREAARSAYERAVVSDPANAEAHYYYARSLVALGVSASAIAHLSRALALDARLAEQARGDAGFRPLADHPSFLAMAG
ncbi:MAG: tetratricopeptide repeat protein [Thermoplasmatota archaeon]